MKTSPIILALDQGTSSSRSLLFDSQLKVLAQASQPLESCFPAPGWVEQDPEQIWRTQKETMEQVLSLAGLRLDEITAIGITNQRETIIAWNRETGEALGPAIVWQCPRTADLCEDLKKKGLEPMFREKTGLVLDPYFSGTKMAWILEHYPGARALASQGHLAFGTVDSWLVNKLSGGRAHVTDPSNASRTLLYNIHQNQWDEELAAPLGVPISALPNVIDSSGMLAYTAASIGAIIPICGIAGDQQAALFGQGCFYTGMAKNTYGTGCFMLANTGEQVVSSDHGLLSTVAWRIGGKTLYALEGSVFMGGALIQWLRDQLGLFEHPSETEEMALSVEDNGGVYLVPGFVGLGAPHWDPFARGLIIGLTRASNKNHIVRAALEAIAFQTADLVQAMAEDLGEPVLQLRVDGGGSVNRFLCQFQADLTGIEVLRPAQLESTALGVAMLAGLGAGVWSGTEELKQLWNLGETFSPRPGDFSPMKAGWDKAVSRSKGWAQ